MNYKSFGNKISALGSLLASGSVATAFMTLPQDALAAAPASWISTLHLIAVASVFIGGFLSGMGKMIVLFADEDADQLAPLRSSISRVPMVVFALLTLTVLTGCETGTRDKRVVAALAGSQKRYETRIANATAREEADEDAIREAHTKQVNIAATRSVDIIASDPVKYPPQVAILEVHRVNQVAQEKIAAQERVLGKMKALRDKDDAINLAGARALMAKVMEYDQAPAVDLTATVQTILSPAPPAKIPEPGK